VSDLRGASRLAVEATVNMTTLVESMHTTMASRPLALGGPVVAATAAGIARLVFTSIRGVTHLVGGGLDAALGLLAPALGDVEGGAGRDAFVAALNGVVGDHLATSGNPLAIDMSFRCHGTSLGLTRPDLAAAIPEASAKVLVLVHGLCLSDRQWRRRGHDHGVALARDLGRTPVYLHYNSGLHISENGRMFADRFQALCHAWPVALDEIAIVAHSMGGLVARSALHQAARAGHDWPRLVRKVVFLGTPHHGAPMERGGQWVHLLLARTPFTAPLARLGRLRSAGITDLRHGFLRDEDWHGHDRFARRAQPHQPMPLPETPRCYAMAASTGKARAGFRTRLLGDGLVPVPSALGQHRDPRFRLSFPPERRAIVYETGHLDLLERREVYERLREWLADSPAPAASPRHRARRRA